MDNIQLEAYKRVLTGHFDEVVYNKSNLIKLFLSSTFSGMR
jgi:hypothetical protein